MIKDEIIKIISQVSGSKLPVVLAEPPRPELGDYSLPVFELAKEAGKNPVEYAKNLQTKILKKVDNKSIIRDVQAAGPYLNIFVSGEKLVREILAGKPEKKKAKGQVALDVFQANPLKQFHIGHLRNAVLGEAIRRLVESQGYKTATYSYSGDVGVHVAKWLWYYKNFYHGAVPKKNFTEWAGELYAQASAKIGEKKEYDEEVNKLNRLIDQRDKSIVKLWQQMTKASYAASWQIAKELECQVNYSFPESVCELPGKKFVQEKIKQGKLKLDQGAWGLDLSAFDLGFFILLKSDGTALYQTKDLGLAQLRNKKIGKYDKCLMVVGSEQEYYFRQLFKIFEILKHPDAGKCQHVPHGLVSLKDGKMASRLGNVISYEELRDKTIAKILQAINEKNSALKNKDQVAKVIALGALKFSLLQVDRLRPVAFDWEQALSFEGNSGPYLQYTYARIRAIERKALAAPKPRRSEAKAGEGGRNQKINFDLLANTEELGLIKIMGKFGEAVDKAAEAYQPYLLANYLLSLAGEFNHFYHQCKVIDPEHPETSQARLFLIAKVAEILQAGLKLLAIGVVEEM